MIPKVVKLRQAQQNSPETSRTDNNIYIWLKKKKEKKIVLMLSPLNVYTAISLVGF